MVGQLASRLIEPRLVVEIEQEALALVKVVPRRARLLRRALQLPRLGDRLNLADLGITISAKSPRHPLDRSFKPAQQARAGTRVECPLLRYLPPAEVPAGRHVAQVGVLLVYLLHEEAPFVSGSGS